MTERPPAYTTEHRVPDAELAALEQAERALRAAHHLLSLCRHAGWCDHKYMLRGIVAEAVAGLDAAHPQTRVAILPPPGVVRALEGGPR